MNYSRTRITDTDTLIVMKRRIPLFWSTMLSILLVYLFLKFGLAYLSMIITGLDRPLPVPRIIMLMFMILVFIGAFVYIAISEENIQEFLRPIVEFLKGWQGGFQKALRLVILVILPLLGGWSVYGRLIPKIQPPTVLRIQHPTIPASYGKLKNPFREADPQTQAKYIGEGRILYQKNCRPCHGTPAKADGPMARGFRLKPIDFTDTGTIATLVESYLFWRIKEGFLSLPPESTPWDSAMPSWKEELKDEEIWKIIMAEYDTAGVEPRKPEKMEE